MRLLELVMIIAICLTACSLLIPQLRSLEKLKFLTPVAACIVLLQILFEGYRWQMLPAYLLALLLLLGWSCRFFKLHMYLPRPVVICLGIVGFFALLLTISLSTLMPVFSFPKPTGPYHVGTDTYQWEDKDRREILSPEPDDNREILAQIWYPTKSTSGPQHPYLDDAHAMFSSVSQGLSQVTDGQTNLPNFLFDHLQYVKTNAFTNAPVTDDQSTYPVLLYLSGLGGFRSANMIQIQELVSHGYIVLGIEQPYVSANVRLRDGRTATMIPRASIEPFIQKSINPNVTVPSLNGTSLPDGIIPYLAEDVPFALSQLEQLKSTARDPLAQRFDLTKIGVFGISLGANVSAEACGKNPNISACLMIDSPMPADVVESGLTQSSMWLTRSAEDMRLERMKSGGWSEESIGQTLGTMKSVFNKQKPGSGYYVSIDGMFHVNFTDAPSWSPVSSQLGLSGAIGTQRGHTIVNEYSLSFFDKTLKNQNPVLLSKQSPFPEVKMDER